MGVDSRRGLGITVIHTRKRSDFEKGHFDTQQLNHLLLDEPEGLRNTFLQHIRGSIHIAKRAISA